MKGYAKIRLAVFLSIMMVLPSIVSVLPMTATEASAASKVTIGWFYDINRLEGTPVQVEKGAKFYVGDYAYVDDGGTFGTATMFSKVKYSSTKKSVASVNSKGYFTAKKTGTTNIKIKYKGKTISQKFTVVKKGTWKQTSAVKGLNKAVKKVKSSIPKKVTKSNAFKTTKARNTYNTSAGKYSSKITSSGFLMETVEYEDGSSSTSPSCKLAVPEAGRYYYLDYLLYAYATKNSPTSTRSSKAMKISSVSASTKQITVKLKKAITEEHILATNIEFSYYNKTPNKKSAVTFVSIYDKTAGENHMGLATLKKGSKTVKIQLAEYVYDEEAGQSVLVTKKLQKGHTYKIGHKKLAWGSGKTVKVK
nr:hypothetical protein [Lachnospiraceae bacterium]